MSREILVHERARMDVVDLAFRIAQDSPAEADRFAEAADSAFTRLADMPGLGVAREYGNPRLTGMRMWPVPGFPRRLIFYRTEGEELHVFRVLHGARDIAHLFAPEEPDDF